MPQAYLSTSGSIGGIDFFASTTRTASGQIGHQEELPAAIAGTLSTKGVGNTGVITLAEEYDIEQDDIIDVYWDGGYRYDVVVTLVDGLEVSFEGGEGDDLPDQDSDLTTQVQTIFDTDFDADLLIMIGAMCGQRGHVSFYEDTVNVLARPLPAGELWDWIKDTGLTNPLAGKVVSHAVVTQASTSVTTFRLGVLYDSTP